MPVDAHDDAHAGAPRPQRVFVEIGTSHELRVSAKVNGVRETSPAGLSEAWHVAHVLTRDRQPATIPWHGVRGDLREAVVGELTVVPRLSDVPSGHVRLDIALRATADDSAPPESEHSAQAVAVETSLILQDQQTIVVKTQASGSRPSQTLLVTPYLIRHDGDLQRLLQCKLRTRADAVAEH